MCVSSKTGQGKNIQTNWIFLSVSCFQPNYNSHNSHVWEASKYSYCTKFHSFAIILSLLCSWPDPLRPLYTDNSLGGAWMPVGSPWRHLKDNSSHCSKIIGIQQPTQLMSLLHIPMYALYILFLPVTGMSGSF